MAKALPPMEGHFFHFSYIKSMKQSGMTTINEQNPCPVRSALAIKLDTTKTPESFLYNECVINHSDYK